MSFILNWLFGPISRFKRGEMVQERDGRTLMTIVKVHTHRKMVEPIVHCHWVEKPQIHRSNIFPERALKGHIALADQSILKSKSFALGSARW